MAACWGITSGSAGMVAQVKALAAAIGVSPEMKKVTIKKPFVWLPNICYAGPLRFILPYVLEGDSLSPPYPELIISCGRRGALAALALRKPGVRLIHIQDPQMPAHYFDAVVAMEHDRIAGPNVIKTRFALHTITPRVMSEAVKHFSPRFAAYPRQQVAVLLGGSTNKYRLAAQGMKQIIASLQQLKKNANCSLLITPSRRTGEHNIALLHAAFAQSPHTYIYDFADENPYLGMLALADYLVVTNDSVNMMSEAHATGKPIYILKLPGHENTKPARFAEMLIREGIARPLGETLESWSYPVGEEMEKLAERIKFPSPAQAGEGI